MSVLRLTFNFWLHYFQFLEKNSHYYLIQNSNCNWKILEFCLLILENPWNFEVWILENKPKCPGKSWNFSSNFGWQPCRMSIKNLKICYIFQWHYIRFGVNVTCNHVLPLSETDLFIMPWNKTRRANFWVVLPCLVNFNFFVLFLRTNFFNRFKQNKRSE